MFIKSSINMVGKTRDDFEIVKRLVRTPQEFHLIRSKERQPDGIYIVLAAGKPAYVAKRWRELFGR